MPFEQTISPIEAYRNPDSVRLVVKNREYQIPLPTARTLCDLLSITIYDESIVALMAKRRRLSHENELLKEKLQSIFQYNRRANRRNHTWKKSQ